MSRPQIRGLAVTNPVATASGTWGFGLEFTHLSNQLGAVVTK
ncbi:dihydroorotate dehydrogenase, partial [candidate division WOR-3 bacterium]|nr:dihydroorotate dehydrogenase [candidate division WOR-3 bacterium]